MTDDLTDGSGLPPKINVRKPKPIAPAEPAAVQQPAPVKAAADEAPTVNPAPKPALKPVVKPAGMTSGVPFSEARRYAVFQPCSACRKVRCRGFGWRCRSDRGSRKAKNDCCKTCDTAVGKTCS
jgi:hypothetical protein